MTELPLSTLEKILAAAKAEFLEKGYQSASLRNIVKSAGVTTGAFYGYYSSKEALFAALVDEPYRFVLRTYRAAVSQFEQLQPQTQVLRMGDAGKDCMQALLLYMDARRDAFHLILECADGTPYSHAEGEKKRLALSVVLSVLSVMLGLAPFYCMYRLVCLFVDGSATAAGVIWWCLLSLAAYAGKILLFSLSTGISHGMAYTILAGLRRRLADRFLRAPLGDVESRSIGEIKSMMVDKIENLEPPLAHMIPEGAGHIVLPIVSIAALLCIDWRLALASLVTFPLSLLCMGLTFKISGESFAKYDRSASYMNSTIVEYIEGIEVIKAFGRAGVSYEKYAAAITDFRTFVVKWLTSTFVTMKLSFALFPSTLIGTLPAAANRPWSS